MKSDKPLSREAASRIYDILVKTCGANESQREQFVFSESSEFITEYRFIGKLGFGGKFYRTDKWRVGCYMEDESNENWTAIKKANEELETLRAELKAEP